MLLFKLILWKNEVVVVVFFGNVVVGMFLDSNYLL